MEAVPRFAPISSQRSTRLKLVAGYFALTGLTVLLVVVVGLAQGVLGRDAELRAVLAADPVVVAHGAAMGSLLLLVGWYLYQRSRTAAVLAAIVFVLPVLSWLLGGEAQGYAHLLGLIGLGLIASVWGELHPFRGPVTQSRGAA